LPDVPLLNLTPPVSPSVSRCFGDGRFKHIGATAQPDVVCCPLAESERGSFVLIACDGVWKTLGVDGAAALAAAELHAVVGLCRCSVCAWPKPMSGALAHASNTFHFLTSARAQSEDRPTQLLRAQHAVNMLVNEAVRRGSDDNVSAILVSVSTVPAMHVALADSKTA
jgi:serine/threonine protein phosphatase PrpC